MRQVHAELRQHRAPRPSRSTLVAERMAARARVLCLDEFFVADIADAMILAGLLEGLFRRGVTLVATSNIAAAGSVQGRPATRAVSAGHRAALQNACRRPAPGRRHRLSVAATGAGADLPGLHARRDIAGAARSSASPRSPAAPPPARRRCRSRTAHIARARHRRRHGVVRIQRTVRRSAQPERLHRARALLPHDLHFEHSGIHARQTRMPRAASSC